MHFKTKTVKIKYISKIHNWFTLQAVMWEARSSRRPPRVARPSQRLLQRAARHETYHYLDAPTWYNRPASAEDILAAFRRNLAGRNSHLPPEPLHVLSL